MQNPQTLDDLKFNEKDCVISGAMRMVSGKPVPVIYGVPSANIRDGRQMTEKEVNEITVVHVPSGISFTANSGGVQMNRKTALAQVKAMVERYIQQAKDAVASEVPGS